MKQITLGRNHDNDVVIDDSSVSRHHATIIQTASGISIIDNGSSNGTFINGKRITQEESLHKNDILKLGTALVPWMNYLDVKVEHPSKPKKSFEEEIPKIEKPVEPTVKKNNIIIPDAPKSVGVGAVKKIFGILIILISLVLIAGGILITLGEKEPIGLVIAIFGLIFLIIGIVRVSTKSRSQVRREAQLIAHNKFQAAIISSQNEGSSISDDVFNKLERLNKLKKQGVITEQEFQDQKNKILN